MSEETIVCPFCKDDGFDELGLYVHLARNYCDAWREWGNRPVDRFGWPVTADNRPEATP